MPTESLGESDGSIHVSEGSEIRISRAALFLLVIGLGIGSGALAAALDGGGGRVRTDIDANGADARLAAWLGARAECDHSDADEVVMHVTDAETPGERNFTFRCADFPTRRDFVDRAPTAQRSRRTR